MKTQRGLLLVFCLAALSFFSLALPCLADKRVALVIGNGAYKNSPALANPPNDAADVAEALKAIGFEVTLKIDLEKRQMDQAVAQFARDGRGADAVLFYYAGHGMQYEGRNYLMPVDAELKDEVSLRYEMIGFDDVKSMMQRSPGVKIMVLDACRDNPLAERFVRSITRSTRDVSIAQGFAPVDGAQGMIVVYATQVDDVAQDGTGRNSPFSAAFLKEIKEPGLEVGSMFRRIAAEVYAATNGRQSPELSISMVPEYYLNQSDTDQTIWGRIRARADYSTLKEFLSRYPNSFYAPDARALMDLLDREAREKADREAAAHDLEQRESRLREEQAKNERSADEARARERELAAKLAAAEDERLKLEQELTQRAADQAAAEARNRSEQERLRKVQEQREADIRAEIDKEQAPASPLEKERLVREALEREPRIQTDQEQARAESERAANEAKKHELQSESDRANALKTQIASLGRQTKDAKVAADAETQRAEDAKKAAAEAANAVATAAVGPVPTPAGPFGAEAPTPRSEQELKARDAFKECAQCPEMVVVPSGAFEMGSSKTDVEDGLAAPNEAPQHRVVVGRPFALSRTEVTKDEFEAFVTASQYTIGNRCHTFENASPQERPDRSFRNPGFVQTGAHPAVCINWQDAMAYVDWLSRTTGKTYRLPTEAEYEYAARAGGDARFGFADDASDLCKFVNGADQSKNLDGFPAKEAAMNCAGGYARTAPAGSLPANAFGLVDLQGNVWEWTADCYHEDYRTASSDGSSAATGLCVARTVRGGSWSSPASFLRPAVRAKAIISDRYDDVGFRVARELD